MMARIISSGFILVAIVAQAHAQAAPIIRPESFEAWEGGGFISRTWKELAAPEATALIQSACAALGANCSSEAAALAKTARETTQLIERGNYRGTARIYSYVGEEYSGMFESPSPGGFTICKAVIDITNGSITSGATFNGTIQRRDAIDGLGFYAVVPKNRPSGQWVRFNLIVQYVPSGTLEQYKCWPDRTVVFQCTGHNCTTYPGARR
jgi:hypothetical protein